MHSTSSTSGSACNSTTRSARAFTTTCLPGVVADLLKHFIARESEGAVAIFSDGKLPPKDDPFIVSKDGEFVDNPLLVRKSDGGYNYATTDLATIRYRHDQFKAQRVIYVVDGRQQMHFRQLFAAAKRWGYGDMNCEHVWFGTILGPDKKPMKTKEGDNVKLKALLAEAEERAGENHRRQAQRATGPHGGERPVNCPPKSGSRWPTINAPRWPASSASARSSTPTSPRTATSTTSSVGKSSSPSTATRRPTSRTPTSASAPSSARPASIRPRPCPSASSNQTSWRSAGKLLDFADSILLAAEEYRPHYLCLYLFDLATLFHKFYESCPVLSAPDDVRESRLVLCDLTARTLASGPQPPRHRRRRADVILWRVRLPP